MTTNSKGLWWVAASALVLVTSACGAPPCNAASCPTGCCAANGLCMTTSTANACGAQGQSCLVCPGGQTCAGGLCVNSGAGGGSASGGGRASGGGSGGGGVTNPNAPTCTASDDCPNWVCECGNGPVNSRRCVNNRCQDGAQACPGACAGFNTCWRGLSSGGFSSGSNAGPSTCGGSGGGGGGGSTQTCPVSDIGRACRDSGDCQSALCFGVNPSYVCTRSCTSASDCPRNWECVTTTSSTRVCMLGPKTSTGTASTSDVCRAVSISDVGSTCSNCQSGFCSGNLCSKRCSSNSECPASWSCVTGDFRYCAP